MTALTVAVRFRVLGRLYDLPAWREGRPGFGLYRIEPDDLTGVMVEVDVDGSVSRRMLRGGEDE